MYMLSNQLFNSVCVCVCVCVCVVCACVRASACVRALLYVYVWFENLICCMKLAVDHVGNAETESFSICGVVCVRVMYMLSSQVFQQCVCVWCVCVVCVCVCVCARAMYQTSRLCIRYARCTIVIFVVFVRTGCASWFVCVSMSDVFVTGSKTP